LLFGAIGTFGGLNPVFVLSGILLFGGSYAAAKKRATEPTEEKQG
jgi:hypothetical protein